MEELKTENWEWRNGGMEEWKMGGPRIAFDLKVRRYLDGGAGGELGEAEGFD